MRAKYDFSGGVRSKYYKARLQGCTIKIHKADGTTFVKHIKREKKITFTKAGRKSTCELKPPIMLKQHKKD
jgi:hypothetical protein